MSRAQRLLVASMGTGVYTVTLQPGSMDGIDTEIRAANPDTNYAAGTTMNTRTTSIVSLLKFDLATIPADAVLFNSALHLRNYSTPASDITVTLHSILAANAAWSEAVATWNYAVNGVTRWAGDAGGDGGADAGCSQSGTDYNAAPLGSFVHAAADPIDTEYVIELDTSMVQDWIDGNNFGLIMYSDTNTNFGIRTSDYAVDPSKRPKLVLAYAGSPPLA